MNVDCERKVLLPKGRHLKIKSSHGRQGSEWQQVTDVKQDDLRKGGWGRWGWENSLQPPCPGLSPAERPPSWPGGQGAVLDLEGRTHRRRPPGKSSD